MSTVIKSQDPCPLCLLQNHVVNHLETRPGQFYSYCTAGHKFEDTEELNILRANAKQKYPNVYRGLEPPKPELPDPALLSNQDIVISAEIKKTIEEMSGVQFTGASDLKGMIFAFIQDNKDKEDELKSLRATTAMLSRRATSGGSKGGQLEPNQFIAKFPEWATEAVAAQAEHAGMTPEDWLNQEIEGYFEQYFSAMPKGR